MSVCLFSLHCKSAFLFLEANSCLMWEYPELSSLVVEMRNISSLSHTDPGAREPAENKLSNTNYVPVNTNCGNTGYMLTVSQHYTHTHLATTAILTVHLNTDCSLRFSLTGYQHDWGLWPRPSTFISTNEMIPPEQTKKHRNKQTSDARQCPTLQSCCAISELLWEKKKSIIHRLWVGHITGNT